MLLARWLEEFGGVVTGPLGGILLVSVVTTWLALRHADRVPRRWLAGSGSLIVLIAALVVVLVSGEVALPLAPLARVELDHRGAEGVVPPFDGSLSLLIHGDLPPIAACAAAIVK